MGIGVEQCRATFQQKYAGDWDAAFNRWSTQLGIPSDDINSWADSCPSNPGYDELANHMTHTYIICIAAMGHMTPGQVQRMHTVTESSNRILYAWAQYYATKAASTRELAAMPDKSIPSAACIGRGYVICMHLMCSSSYIKYNMYREKCT